MRVKYDSDDLTSEYCESKCATRLDRLRNFKRSRHYKIFVSWSYNVELLDRTD